MFALVDDDKYENLMQRKWYAKNNGGKFYAAAATGRKVTYMHREILGVFDSKIHVDHKDGNGLNNQCSNIRLCSSKENMRNRRVSRNNSSGLSGVSWDSINGKWKATIGINGKQKTIGRFSLIDDAIRARLKAAEIYFGEFNGHISHKI